MTQPNDPVAGRNPEYGAAFSYFLSEGFEEKLELNIFDAEGRKIRQLEKLPAKAGINRVFWDFAWDEPTEIKIRTRPLENTKVPLPDRGWRDMPDGFRLPILAAPGTYKVELVTIGKKKEGAGEEEEAPGGRTNKPSSSCSIPTRR